MRSLMVLVVGWLIVGASAFAQPSEAQKAQYTDVFILSSLKPCDNPKVYARVADDSCVRWEDLPVRTLEGDDSRMVEVKDPLPPPKGRAAKTGAGRMDLLVEFRKGSAELSEISRANVRALAESMKTPALAGKSVLISGHTDVTGGERVNRPLSLARARAVRDYLIELGVSPAMLKVQGMASDQLLPEHDRASARQRRVEASQGY